MSAFSQALNGHTSNQAIPSKESSGKERLEQIKSALHREGAVITGIGARDTPTPDLNLLTKIAAEAEKKRMKGRSGGAGGADLAFERGFKDPKNIDVILPWKSFLPKDMNQEDVTKYLGRERLKYGPGAPVMLQGAKIKEALDLAEKYHPAWDKCSDAVKSLHSRNMPQILGLELNEKSDIVIAWTKDGKATGGTGQAIRIAEDLGIPVANLKNPEDRKAVLEALGISDSNLDMQRAYQQNQNQGLSM